MGLRLLSQSVLKPEIYDPSVDEWLTHIEFWTAGRFKNCSYVCMHVCHLCVYIDVYLCGSQRVILVCVLFSWFLPQYLWNMAIYRTYISLIFLASSRFACPPLLHTEIIDMYCHAPTVSGRGGYINHEADKATSHWQHTHFKGMFSVAYFL